MRIVACIFLFFCLSLTVFAGEETQIIGNRSEAVIRFNQIDWQTYEFYPAVNSAQTNLVSYQWTIDNSDIFSKEKIRYVFNQGEHQISFRAKDKTGNYVYDLVTLKVNFWSFYNRYLVWSIYGFVILTLVYYWTLKLIYLFNKQKIKRQTRQFLEILDNHGFVEKFVASLVKKSKKI